MTDLTDRLLRHADLHADQPWADDEQMQFARDLRDAAALLVSKALTDTQKPVSWTDLCGAVARGWCHASNANKEMDVDLAFAIADEVQRLWGAAPQAQPAQRLPLVQATAPREIWLQVSDDAEHSAEPFPTDNDGITWAKDAALMCAVPYVRADLAQAQPAPAQRLSDVLLDIDSVEHMQGGANGPTIRLRGFINAQTVPTAPQPPIDNAFVAEGCERFSTPAEPAPVPCCGKYETCSHACTPRGRWLGRRESALQPGWRDIESAPKDGTDDVWLHADGKVLRAFWLVKPYRETRDLDGNYIDHQDYDEFWMSCADGDEVEDPTEWMPISVPVAPKGTT